nr:MULTISPECIES: hypothetical protein [Myxococcaceae]
MLSLLLAATPPPAPARAEALARSGRWDALYLAYAAVSPERYAPSERTALSRALARGCAAELRNDAVLASALGERAARFEPTAAALRCLARAALATEQRAAAESALREGMRRHPGDGGFALALGELLQSEGDAAGARAALLQVPAGSPEAARASALLAAAQAAEAEGVEASTAAPEGLHVRESGRFVVRYLDRTRDFGQRADYEGRCVAALEEAYAHTRSLLGRAREAPVDVLFLTREQFARAHGPQAARSIAGLYAGGAIRINQALGDAGELTADTRATLVHEYVHSALDELGGGAGALPTWLNEGLAEYVEWRYLGSDAPPRPLAARLAAAARAGTLPSIGAMAHGALIAQGDPGLAYALSALAVRELLRQEGPARLLTLVREVGEGRPFDAVLQARYGRSVASLDEELKSVLSRR